MPTAYHRTSRLLPAGTPVWPRSFGRLHRARSRLCLTRGSIGPGTQKIAWDSIWGDSATEADTLEGREPEFSLPRNTHEKGQCHGLAYLREGYCGPRRS